MVAKKLALVWIVVSDMEKAKEFYCNKLGMTLDNESSEFGWAELLAKDGGARLGLATASPAFQAGMNAVVTLTVDNIEEAIVDFKSKNIELLGEVMEVPGHVKLQMFIDDDGNKFQIVELLNQKT